MTTRMKDIAQALNVSVVTVSKVLRNHSDISPATRERVLKKIEEFNYQPNWIAQSLVTQRTYLVSCLVPDLRNSFHAEVVNGIARRLRPAGYEVVIANSEENPELETQEIERLLGRRMDGLLVASAQQPGQPEVLKRLGKQQVPYVLIDRDFPGLKANYVGGDNEKIGELATTHLIELGRRRIAHLRGPDNSTALGRWKGYRRALAAHGLPLRAAQVVNGGHSDETGYQGMRQLLQRSPAPDGVVCYNDLVAVGALRAILEAKLRVPRDLAIIGAGNHFFSDLLKIPLSTIDQNSAQMGERAGELLLEAMQSKEPLRRRILIEPKLVIRASTGTARR